MSHSLSIGIVGLPNVGKSTLFKILTKQDITIANYPFATIDPNVGIVSVPDERVDKLTALSKSRKKIPAVAAGISQTQPVSKPQGQPRKRFWPKKK